MKLRKLILAPIAAAVMSFGVAGPAAAATTPFWISPGIHDQYGNPLRTTNSDGENTWGTATFETFTNKNYIALTLTNTSAPLISVGQAFTGILFNTTPNVTFTDVRVLAGEEYMIDANGNKSVYQTTTIYQPVSTPVTVITYCTSTTSTNCTPKANKTHAVLHSTTTYTTTQVPKLTTSEVPEQAWYLGVDVPQPPAEQGLSVFGNGQPHNSLLPMQDSYADTNASIKGNGPHNPFYLGSVTFALYTTNLSSTGGTDGISIDQNSVYFEFGTKPDVLLAVPEPETYAMMLAGLGLMGFIARRRKQSNAAA